MGTVIDNRVVKMAFDNQEFERGVGQSMKTIGGLKKGLEFDESIRSINNLGSAARSLSLAGIADGVQSISSRFTALGIVGMTTLMNITNAAINTGTAMVKALTIDPIKMGFQEYETQMNAVQTILANTSTKGTTLKDVSAALDELNTYADRTIYNFTQMTRNIGTFTAAGTDLDTSVAAIKGIANLAAVSGSNAEQASTAMYQLSQAMASGTVKLMDWNSVVNAGMGGQVFQDALKETARVSGVNIDAIIAKNGSFRESLQEGWLTKDILTATLAKFTGDLTESQLRAAGYTEDQIQANLKLGKMANDAATKVKTFTQLWSTLKEAAQSGWSKTWQIVVGDFEEAKLFMTEINDIMGAIIGSSAKSRNDMLQGWSDLGGRADMIQSLRNIFEGLMSVIKPITEALRVFFPPITSEQLFAFTEGIKNLTAKFKIGSKVATEIRRIFKGVFAIFDIGRLAVVAIAKGFGQLVGSMGPATNGLLSIIAKVGDLAVALRNYIKFNDVFGKVIRFIGSIIVFAAAGIKTFADAFTKAIDKFKEFSKTNGIFLAVIEGFKTFVATFTNPDGIDFGPLSNLIERFKERFATLSTIGDGIGKVFGKLFAVIGKVFDKISPIFTKIRETVLGAMGRALDSILAWIDKIDFSKVSFKGIFDGLNLGLTGALLLSLSGFTKKGPDFFKNIERILTGAEGFVASATSILDGVKSVLDGVRESLQTWQEQVRSQVIMKIAIAIAILAVSLIALSMVDSKKLTYAIGAVSLMFAELFGVMATYEKVSTGGVSSVGQAIAGILAMSGAMLVMSLAVVNLAKIEPDRLGAAIGTVLGMISAMLLATFVMSKIPTSSMVKTSLGLLVFSFAISAMVKPLKKIGEIDAENLSRGLKGLAWMLTELAVFMAVNQGSMSVKDAAGLIVMSLAISTLAWAVGKFGKMDQGEAVQGLTTMGLILAGLAAFTKLTKNTGSVIETAASLVIIGGAMIIFSLALERMGKLSWNQLAIGLVGIAGALTAVVLAMTYMPKDMLLTGVALAVVAGAIYILANALVIMGSLTWEEMAVGLLALGGSMVILAVGLNAMTSALPGSAALIVAAAAIAILTPQLKALGSMSLEQVGIGLLALVGIFTVLGLAGLILTPVVPTLAALAGAMLLLGGAALAVGLGLLFFSMGMAALSVSGAAGVSAIVLLVTGMVGLLPMIGGAIAEAFVNMLTQLELAGPKLWSSVKGLLMGLINAVFEMVPEIVIGILELVNALVTALVDNIPTLVEKGYELLKGILLGIWENVGDVTKLGMAIVREFMRAISEQLPSLIDAGYEMILSFINGLADAVDKYLPEIMTAMARLAVAIINGLVEGWQGQKKEVVKGMKALGKLIVDAFKEMLGIRSPSKVFSDLGKMTIQGFIDGLSLMIVNLRTKIIEVAANVVSSFQSKYADFVQQGRELVFRLIDGLNETKNSIVSKIVEVIVATITGIQTKYEEFKMAGIQLIEYISNGIYVVRTLIKDKVIELVNNAWTAITEAYIIYKTAGSDLINNLKDGMSNILAGLVSLAHSLASDPLGTIRSYISNFWNAGYDLINNVKSGMANLSSSVVSTASGMINSAVSSILTWVSSMANAGYQLVVGLRDGIANSIYIAVNKAYQLANSVLDIIQDVLGINSPSKETASMGRSMIEGLVLGMAQDGHLAETAAADLADTTLSSLSGVLGRISDAINSDLDLAPTIRPVLDLSEISKGGKLINGLLPKKTFNVSASANKATGITTRTNAVPEINAPGAVVSQAPSITFTQNNYSPKALSRIDIYRQTRNQLTSLKKMVGV